MGKEHIILIHHPDIPSARFCSGDLLIAQEDLPRIRYVDTREGLQKNCFSRSGRTENDEVFIGPYLK
jgi:hypothetical protein